MNPRDLPPIRHTSIHSAPVRGYKLEVELNGIRTAPLDLSKYGLRVADFGSASAARATGGELGDYLIGIYVDPDGQVWICTLLDFGFQPFLFPVPWERVQYEAGDDVCNDWLPDPGAPLSGQHRLRCGKVLLADPKAADPKVLKDPRFAEKLRVLWDGAASEELAYTGGGLRLRRNELPSRHP